MSNILELNYKEMAFVVGGKRRLNCPPLWCVVPTFIVFALHSALTTIVFLNVWSLTEKIRESEEENAELKKELADCKPENSEENNSSQ